MGKLHVLIHLSIDGAVIQYGKTIYIFVIDGAVIQYGKTIYIFVDRCRCDTIWENYLYIC